MDLVPKIDVVTPSMGTLEPSLPFVDPSHECSFQDVVLSLDKYPLESMYSLDIPLGVDVMVLFNDHIFGMDCPIAKPSPNFPSEHELE